MAYLDCRYPPQPIGIPVETIVLRMCDRSHSIGFSPESRCRARVVLLFPLRRAGPFMNIFDAVIMLKRLCVPSYRDRVYSLCL